MLASHAGCFGCIPNCNVRIYSPFTAAVTASFEVDNPIIWHEIICQMLCVPLVRKFLFLFSIHHTGWLNQRGKMKRPWCSATLRAWGRHGQHTSSLMRQPQISDEREARNAGGPSLLCILHASVSDTCVGLPQDCALSLADGRGKGSTHLSGSPENLEWRHPAHLHRDPQWEGWYPHWLHKVGGQRKKHTLNRK